MSDFRKLHEPSFDDADAMLQTLINVGYRPDGDTRILDFGCGDGRLVHSLRDKGFQAFGFDIHERVNYRGAEDADLFRFSPKDALVDAGSQASGKLRDGTFHLPFADGTFDLVLSTSVLEHVMDLHPVMSEIARVSKPDGVALHLFPQMSLLVEPHIYVPLGTVFQRLRFVNWAYFYLWALIGVRAEGQAAMSPDAVATSNAVFCRDSLSYRTKRAIRRICGRSFDEVRFVEDAHFAKDLPEEPLGQRIRDARRGDNPFREFSVRQRMSVLFTGRKKLPVAAV